MLKHVYTFNFNDGTTKKFSIDVDPETLNIVTKKKEEYPEWMELEEFKCSCCPLDKSEHKYCPVITNLLDIIGSFKESISYEEVEVIIETEDRTYAKNTSLQNGLNSIIGLIMPISGCPLLEKLKPMVRFHLPFATLDETNFRMMSMYLFAQYFISKQGGNPDWELKNLVEIYDNIRTVNKNFCEKLSALKVKDASINALVTLDCFAFSVSYSIDSDKLDKIKKLYGAYLKNPS